MSVVVVREGDEREREILVEAGEYRTYEQGGRRVGHIVSSPTYVTIIERWEGDWQRQGYRWETARPAPTRWQRVQAWLGLRPSLLPVARVVKL